MLAGRANQAPGSQGERGPFHTRQILFPPSLDALKDTHQGISLCPWACLATTTPYQHSVCVCAFLPHPSSEVSFIFDLHSKRNLLTSLWFSVWTPSTAAPSDSLLDWKSGKSTEIWFVYVRNRSSSGHTFPNARQITVFWKWNGVELKKDCKTVQSDIHSCSLTS